MKIVETNKLLETARKNGYTEDDIKQISELLNETPEVNAKIVFCVGDIVYWREGKIYGVVVGEEGDKFKILTDDKLKRPVKISVNSWELDYTGKQMNGINYMLKGIIEEVE